MSAPAIHPPESGIEWLSRDSCDSHIERRRDQLRKDEDALGLARDGLLRAQKEAIVQGLCRMNKDVKRMTVKDFNEAFGCDLAVLIGTQIEAGDAAGGGAKSVWFQTPTGGIGSGLKTPAPHGRPGGLPMSRRARKGERIIYTSVNGSPIDQPAHGEVVVTAKKRRAMDTSNAGGKSGGGLATDRLSISIGIGAGDGDTIDLSDPNQRMHLDGEQKAHAMQQLMAIQEQMNELMEGF